ncbi:MAG: hypothetical protein JSW67_09520 [Candidatus Latescibacterota bacterium]|nr:MAG: hypothetical protein JSW67_09520 [Candidatus Latescibacterota bacterium]
MLRPTRVPMLLLGCVLLAAAPASAQFFCEEPRDEHKLELCSPLATHLVTEIVPEGLKISWNAPPREQTTYMSPLMSVVWLEADGDSLAEGETVTDIPVTGTYLGVVDQRIEIAITQIGANLDFGVLGVDDVTVAWSSVFRPVDDPFGVKRLLFELDETNVDVPLQFIVESPGQQDTTIVPGLRIQFPSGLRVGKGWTAVFDVEDFEGFRVWRWLSNPTLPPLAVGTYSKVSAFEEPESEEHPRPADAWAGATPFSTQYTFLDRFVIDGATYHYAVTTFDQGFNRTSGGTAGASPFESPPWEPVCPTDPSSAAGCMPPAPSATDPGPTILRFDFLRPPPQSFTAVNAYPNPYRQRDCDARGEDLFCNVFFKNMPPRGTLFIYTMAGDLVTRFDHPDDQNRDDPPGTLRWNTRNGRGNPPSGPEVASGVYIYKIVDLESGEESFGRLAIIR